MFKIIQVYVRFKIFLHTHFKQSLVKQSRVYIVTAIKNVKDQILNNITGIPLLQLFNAHLLLMEA